MRHFSIEELLGWARGCLWVNLVRVSDSFVAVVLSRAQPETWIAKEASAADIVSSDAYTLHRILHGVPEGLTDIPAMQAFPMDSNLDVMGGRV